MLPVKYWILCPSTYFVICVKSSQAKAASQNWYFIPLPEEFWATEKELQITYKAEDASAFLVLNVQLRDWINE